MTVKELKEKLEHYPEDAIITVDDGTGCLKLEDVGVLYNSSTKIVAII